MKARIIRNHQNLLQEDLKLPINILIFPSPNDTWFPDTIFSIVRDKSKIFIRVMPTDKDDRVFIVGGFDLERRKLTSL